MIIEWAEEHGAWRGRGEDHHYLIAADPDRGEVKLTRWNPAGEDGLEDPKLQALVNTVSLQAPRGPGRPPGEPEVAALVTQAREDCQLFEDGKRVPWAMACPAWRTRQRFTYLPEPVIVVDMDEVSGEEVDTDLLAGMFREMVADGHLSEEHAEEALTRARQGLRSHGLLRRLAASRGGPVAHGPITGWLAKERFARRYTDPGLPETGEPFRSGAEHDWNESRGD